MADGTLHQVADDYEQRLDRNPEWAMSEGSRHFDEKSSVHRTLRGICKRLDELGIVYAVVGGMALFKHGFRRFTEDVDILVTRESLKQIHKALTGLGYTPPFSKSKNLRDTQTGVRIEFLISGGYPGDGKEKPVVFPDPGEVNERIGDIFYIKLPSLVELKLASGMTGPDRMKDLADVQELIKILSLPASLSDQMNPYVREKYIEIWTASQSTIRYVRVFNSELHSQDFETIEGLIEELSESDPNLPKMLADGVTIDSHRSTGSEIYLVTDDPEIAKKYDMHDESEYWDEEE